MKNKYLVIFLTCFVFVAVSFVCLKVLFTVRDISVSYSVVNESNAEEVSSILDKYKGKLIINNGAPYLVEAVNPAYTKGNAVRFIANRYGIPLKEVIAVGDSTNDLELVGGPWRGVAVGDGSEELKKVTDEVTAPYKSHPVKTILEKYCL